MNESIKTRCSGIDLLKTLAMFMVVILHVLNKGGVLEASLDDPIRFGVVGFVDSLSLCAVNCFALATGYLMIESNFKYRKIIPLWFTVFFIQL